MKVMWNHTWSLPTTTSEKLAIVRVLRKGEGRRVLSLLDAMKIAKGEIHEFSVENAEDAVVLGERIEAVGGQLLGECLSCGTVQPVWALDGWGCTGNPGCMY